MGKTITHPLFALLVAASAILLVACEDESKWQHPNRERYPAPLSSPDDRASIEELEETWARQDALRRGAERRAERQDQPLPAEANTVDVAAHQIRQALGAAFDRTRSPGPPPVGGGPPE